MITLTASRREGPKPVRTDSDSFIQSVRDALSLYGRDYAIGAVRGLAVRNMMSVSLPDTTDGFYPIVKVHEMVLKDLEDIFYHHVRSGMDEVSREELIRGLIEQEVWEQGPD